MVFNDQAADALQSNKVIKFHGITKRDAGDEFDESITDFIFNRGGETRHARFRETDAGVEKLFDRAVGGPTIDQKARTYEFSVVEPDDTPIEF
jgi:hypothetical protein